MRLAVLGLGHVGTLTAAGLASRSQVCDVAVVAKSDRIALDELQSAPRTLILNLYGRLGCDVERLAGYEKIGWTV